MITLTNVSKQFAGEEVIKKISLSIDAGEIVGFLGPNGAGKTTTIRMIAGVLPPTQGKVIVDDIDMTAEDLATRPHIGYLPENNPLYDDLTVEEFLKLWAQLKNIPEDKITANIKEAITLTGLQDVYYRPITELSKGYRQRTGLAQAILSQPDILLLDEPTEGLDPNQRRDIHKLLKGIGKKRTVIICSHVLPEVTKMCNRILIINQGKIVADGKTDELGQLDGGQQHYQLIASGAGIATQLKKLTGVKKVSSEPGKPAASWTLSSTAKKDLRLDIFTLAKKHNWKLYELTKKEQNLEDVFERLTK